MIRITVEVLRAGAPKRERDLEGIIEISNDESTNGSLANYDVVVSRQGRRRRGRMQHARIEGFPRESGDVWSLLREALGALDRKDGIE